MYEQTFEIEHRLNDLLRLVEEGRYSTPRLAERLAVSIPTVSRGIRALRGRGHCIKARRLDDGSWCYRIDLSEHGFDVLNVPRSSESREHASSRVST